MKKADHSIARGSIKHFQQIINVGPATAGDFERLGFQSPQQLVGKDPFQLYSDICQADEERHDPCVLDVFMATIDFMNGNPPRVWWNYTDFRKSKYACDLERLDTKFQNLDNG